MNKHKDLPPASQAWAKELDDALETIAHLKEVVRRLSENAGLDFSNPQRGLNPTRDIPSNGNPVGQKLSSLADVQTYNVADKQVLSWSGKDQKWLPITPDSGGAFWHLATEEEHLRGDLDADSDYYSTQVSGLYAKDVDGGRPDDDGYGLVGTSTSSAFLHGAQRWWGGPTKAHGYVVAQPYYCKMGVAWIDDTGGATGGYGLDAWGEVGIDREDVWIQTPTGQPTEMKSQEGQLQRDGSVIIKTNWFYVPQVNGIWSSYWNIRFPKRPVPLSENGIPSAGAMVYDMTLKKPLWWDGVGEWKDALGNSVPAADY